MESKFSIGDTVRTHENEIGVIDHAWSGDASSEYKWWVTIPIKGSLQKSVLPYRESELTLVTADEAQATASP